MLLLLIRWLSITIVLPPASNQWRHRKMALECGHCRNPSMKRQMEALPFCLPFSLSKKVRRKRIKVIKCLLCIVELLWIKAWKCTLVYFKRLVWMSSGEIRRKKKLQAGVIITRHQWKSNFHSLTAEGVNEHLGLVIITSIQRQKVLCLSQGSKVRSKPDF